MTKYNREPKQMTCTWKRLAERFIIYNIEYENKYSYLDIPASFSEKIPQKGLLNRMQSKNKKFFKLISDVLANRRTHTHPSLRKTPREV